MPRPPNDQEKDWYLDQNKKLILFSSGMSSVILIIGWFLFATQRIEMIAFIPLFLFLSIYLILSYVVCAAGQSFNRSRLDYVSHRMPSIDVYLPSAGEDIGVLRETYQHASEIDYGHLNVFVLDDSGRESVKELSKEFGFTYIARRENGWMKKAGNLRFAFRHTNGDWILILDADFCPRKDIITEMLKFADPSVAIIQTPQFFRQEGNWIQNAQAFIQELFYRLIQVNRDTWNAAICVGTCALYRRIALLPHGGTALIDYSEDVHTGFQLLKDGWKISYVPLNLAAGICPDTGEQFFNQQYRWCMGSFSLFLSKDFWRTPLDIWQRLAFLSGMIYYQATALGIFLQPLPGLIIVWFIPQAIYWYNCLFSIPSLIVSSVIIGIWSRNKFSISTYQVRLISYWAHFFAIKDRLIGDRMPWQATGTKQKSKGRFDSAMKIHFAWSSLVLVLSIAGSINHFSSNVIPFLGLSLFWGGINFGLLRRVWRFRNSL